MTGLLQSLLGRKAPEESLGAITFEKYDLANGLYDGKPIDKAPGHCQDVDGDWCINPRFLSQEQVKRLDGVRAEDLKAEGSQGYKIPKLLTLFGYNTASAPSKLAEQSLGSIDDKIDDGRALDMPAREFFYGKNAEDKNSSAGKTAEADIQWAAREFNAVFTDYLAKEHPEEFIALDYKPGTSTDETLKVLDGYFRLCADDLHRTLVEVHKQHEAMKLTSDTLVDAKSKLRLNMKVPREKKALEKQALNKNQFSSYQLQSTELMSKVDSLYEKARDHFNQIGKYGVLIEAILSEYIGIGSDKAEEAMSQLSQDVKKQVQARVANRGAYVLQAARASDKAVRLAEQASDDEDQKATLLAKLQAKQQKTAQRAQSVASSFNAGSTSRALIPSKLEGKLIIQATSEEGKLVESTYGTTQLTPYVVTDQDKERALDAAIVFGERFHGKLMTARKSAYGKNGQSVEDLATMYIKETELVDELRDTTVDKQLSQQVELLNNCVQALTEARLAHNEMRFAVNDEPDTYVPLLDAESKEIKRRELRLAKLLHVIAAKTFGDPMTDEEVAVESEKQQVYGHMQGLPAPESKA